MTEARPAMTEPRPGATTEVHRDTASAIHAGAARVVAWMLHEGRANTHMREFGDDMCRRVVEAGIPLWRAFCAIRTLHPQIAANAYVWRRGETGATRRAAEHGIEKDTGLRAEPADRSDADRRGHSPASGRSRNPAGLRDTRPVPGQHAGLSGQGHDERG